MIMMMMMMMMMMIADDVEVYYFFYTDIGKIINAPKSYFQDGTHSRAHIPLQFPINE